MSQFSILQGCSTSASATQAVEELAASIQQENMKMVMFFCSIHYDRSELANALNNTFPDTEVIGCTTGGEMTPDGLKDGALTGFSISGDEFHVETMCIPIDEIDIDQTINKSQIMHQKIKDVGLESGQKLLWVLSDSSTGHIEPLLGVLNGIFLKDVEIVGGSAGAGDNFEQAWVFCGTHFKRHCCRIALITTTMPFKTFKVSNFVEKGEKLVLTDVDPITRVVKEINGKPAQLAYLEASGGSLDDVNMRYYAENPLAVRVADDLYVRALTPPNGNRDMPKGALQFFCAVEEGMVLTTVEPQDLVESLKNSFEKLKGEVGEPLLTLGCDCLYRKFEYEHHDVQEEVSNILKQFNVVGFHGYGEHLGAMHVNQTLTGVYFGATLSE